MKLNSGEKQTNLINIISRLSLTTETERESLLVALVFPKKQVLLESGSRPNSGSDSAHGLSSVFCTQAELSNQKRHHQRRRPRHAPMTVHEDRLVFRSFYANKLRSSKKIWVGALEPVVVQVRQRHDLDLGTLLPQHVTELGGAAAQDGTDPEFPQQRRVDMV